MAVNFKRGFQRIFSVICTIIILIGGIISWYIALSAMNKATLDGIELQCTYENSSSCPQHSYYVFSQNDISDTNFHYFLINDKYCNHCIFNQNYSLKGILNSTDYVYNGSNNKPLVRLKYSYYNSNGYINNFDSLDVDIDEFAEALNMKVIKKQGYEYIPAFIDSFMSDFGITLLIAGSVYGIFLLFAWMFSGFSKQDA